MEITTSWGNFGNGRTITVSDEFDWDGDAAVSVNDGAVESATAWINADSARQLRDHLTGLLGENLAEAEPVEITAEPVTDKQYSLGTVENFLAPSDVFYQRVAAYDAVTRRIAANAALGTDADAELAKLLDEPLPEPETSVVGIETRDSVTVTLLRSYGKSGFVGLDVVRKESDGRHTEITTNIDFDQARILRDALIAADLGDRG